MLRRWHPGAGVELEGAAEEPARAWRWYAPGPTPGSVVVDAAALECEKGDSLGMIERILHQTAQRPGASAASACTNGPWCTGRSKHRNPVPLRLGQDATDAVVEGNELRCTHFDAFRFFTPEAVPRNRDRPLREAQPAMEQPGRLHAGMDVYKWAVKLGPSCPARCCSTRSSSPATSAFSTCRPPPTTWRRGRRPGAHRDAEGKAEYVRRQRAFAERSNALRGGILGAWRPERRSLSRRALRAGHEPPPSAAR